jgi:glucose-1-phosphate thymidylyltransferase
MKGVILAGGKGTRLWPVTKFVNKHLLNVYDLPMVMYPIFTLADAGIKEILLVSNPEFIEDFKELLGDGSQFGVRIDYAIQPEATGISDALARAEEFAAGEQILVILGDNVIEDDLRCVVNNFGEAGQDEALVFLKEVPRPSAYGVAEVEEDIILNIEEKPENPRSNLAVIGCYIYGGGVFDLIRTLSPSERGELEITDLNNIYLADKKLHYHVLQGFWRDCGESFESLHEAATFVRETRFRRERRKEEVEVKSEKLKVKS